MKTIPIETETVDLATGAATKAPGRASLLPPRPGACKTCGRYPAHEPEQPHDAMSLYYMYAFYGEHGRWPTWKDALAHCPPDIQAHWEGELRKVGAWTEPAPH